ncbi:hypothetical protein CHUAL_011988 [Chamberlinius hualienensis]
MKKFAVVHFVVHSVDFVPSLWLSTDQRTCFYPKFRFPEFEALKRNYECLPQKGLIGYKVNYMFTTLLVYYCAGFVLVG